MFHLNKIITICTRTNKYSVKILGNNVFISSINSKCYHKNGLSKSVVKIESESVNKAAEVPKELIDKDDPDRFGVLSGTAIHTDKYDFDKGDKKEEAFIGELPTYLRTVQYAKIIKDHLVHKRLKEALDVLEVKMLEEDKAKPYNYIYNLLIAGCAAAGYTKKSFKLFNDMKKRNLKVTGGTYTSLFNACANSPWPKDGLRRANYLRELMLEKNYEPNITNYNVMIKAFGRNNDLQTAFSLVDEMIDRKLEIPVSTMNFLLQACITDKKAGFRHALLVWRKMLQMKKKPDTYTFNLLLHCVQDCGLGDLKDSKLFFDNIIENSKELKGTSKQLLLESPKSNDLIESNNQEQTYSDVPNLLSKDPQLGKIVDVSDITQPEHRLYLLGGASGFLKQMYLHKAVPDIKTYTQLLQTIPPTNSAEISLLKMMKRTGDKVDVCFFNMLMKRRVVRFDYEGAKEVLNMIKTAGLKTDLITYGILAMTCETKFEARDLLDDINSYGHRPNAEILGTMLKTACKKISFGYVRLIMNTIVDEIIRPNESIYNILEDFQKQCMKSSEDLHNKVYCEHLKNINHEYFTTLYPKFANDYTLWLGKVEKLFPKRKIHPWEQFRESLEQGFEGRKEFEKRRKIKKRFIRAIA